LSPPQEHKRACPDALKAGLGNQHQQTLMNFYILLADLVAVVHAAYVAFVVIGFALIIAGLLMRREWSQAFWFRAAHLIAIVFVCTEAVMGVVCPLTTLESRLRALGGETDYSRDFVGYWVDRLIFYDLPTWVFMFAYVALCVAVVTLFVFAPPRWPRSRSNA
jgi:hypothetical protein